MNSTARSFLSTLALGLAATTIASAFLAGFSAPLTVSGFSFLAVYALIEIALVSYVPAPSVRASRLTPAPVAPRAATVRRARVSALVEYPTVVASRRAA